MNPKPFIKRYRSPRGFYFYDVNKATIVSVNSDVYDYLGDKMSFEDLSADDQAFVNELKNDGYLSDKHFSTIRHPNLDTLEYDVTRRCYQLILQVTQSCNLVCSYCAYANKTDGPMQRHHSNKMMTWETAKEAIDMFFKNSIDCTEVSMSFYGGEPVIAFDLVKKSVEYAKKLFLGKKLSFNMTTNATLLNDDVINYLLDNEFSLLFSIDGPEAIHDINRRRADGTGSFKSAFSNLRKVAEKYSAKYGKIVDKVGINTVLNPVNDLDLVLSLYDDELFKKYDINITMTMADDDLLEDKIIVPEDYRVKMGYHYFLGWLDSLKIVDGLKLIPCVKNRNDLLPKNYAESKRGQISLPDVGAPGGPCIPGQRRLFMNADGNIFPCERVSEVADVMNFGNVRDGIDLKKAGDILNVASLTPEMCKECYASSKCSTCAKDCINEKGFDPAERAKHCKDVCATFDDSIMTMIVMKESRTLYTRRVH